MSLINWEERERDRIKKQTLAFNSAITQEDIENNPRVRLARGRRIYVCLREYVSRKIQLEQGAIGLTGLRILEPRICHRWKYYDRDYWRIVTLATLALPPEKISGCK